jgi:hypothetical protein
MFVEALPRRHRPGVPRYGAHYTLKAAVRGIFEPGLSLEDVTLLLAAPEGLVQSLCGSY